MLLDPVGRQRREIVRGQLDHPGEVAPIEASLREIGRGHKPEPQVPEARGKLHRPGARHKRLVQLAEQCVDVRQTSAGPAAPAIVVQPFSEGLGLTQALQPPMDLAEQVQHGPELETDLETLLHGGLALRQHREGTQRLIEPDPGLRKRRPRGRLNAGFPEIVHRLLPHLATERVMGEALDLLGEPIAVETLHGLGDPSVEVTAPAREEAPIGHLMGERVLERVLEVGEEARLVDKLGRLKVSQLTTERLLVLVRDSLEESEGKVLPDDRGNLEEPLLIGRQAVDARGQDGLHRAGHVDGGQVARQLVGASRARQRARLDQRSYTLLEEKRIALGSPDQEALERVQAGVAPEEYLEQHARHSPVGSGSIRSCV